MVIAIVGPTCVGKTKLSVELAKQLNGEIINADSTQVFKNLDIATAKVTEEEKEGIPHHLFDIKEITETYTVYDYQKDCRLKIEEIIKKNKLPILVGGTGLYIKAALYDYQFEEEKPTLEYQEATDILYQKLLKVDSHTAIHPNNRKRIIRALQYYEQHKVPMSEKETTTKLLYPTLFIGLTTDREVLYEKINQRVDKMIQQGLLTEAKTIYDSNIRTKAILTPIGYKELFPYFENYCSLDQAINQIKQNSRHYAKRQYTWFHHQIPVEWFSVNFGNFNETVQKVLIYIHKKI